MRAYDDHSQRPVLRCFTVSFLIVVRFAVFQPGVWGGGAFYAQDLFWEGWSHRMLPHSYHRPPRNDRTENHLGSFQLSTGYRLQEQREGPFRPLPALAALIAVNF